MVIEAAAFVYLAPLKGGRIDGVVKCPLPASCLHTVTSLRSFTTCMQVQPQHRIHTAATRQPALSVAAYCSVSRKCRALHMPGIDALLASPT